MPANRRKPARAHVQTWAAELRALRAAHGFDTMAAAATFAGVPYRTWQDWELGHSQPRAFYRAGVRALFAPKKRPKKR